MKHPLTLALIAVGSCTGSAANQPPPPPAPTVVAVSDDRDAEAKTLNTCSAACAALKALGCPSWAPEGGTCADGCAAAHEALGASLSLACISKSTSCAAAAACLK